MRACPTNTVYPTAFVIHDDERGEPSLFMQGRNRGGFAGEQALIVPDHGAIDRLCLLFTATTQIVGDQAEVAVRVAACLQGETIISTFAPIDDDKYKDSIVLITDDPLMKAVARVRDESIHLLDVGKAWPNTHEEAGYYLPPGYVQRTTLQRNPLDGFGFHLGLRLRDADERAVPVVQDLNVKASRPERWFDLEQHTTDRVVYLGVGGFVEEDLLGVSGKVRRVFLTADESPIFEAGAFGATIEEAKARAASAAATEDAIGEFTKSLAAVLLGGGRKPHVH